MKIAWTVEFCLAAYCCIANAQDIDFNALKRPSTPVVKRYTVSGTASDGYNYLQGFIKNDDERVDAFNSMFNGSSSGGSDSSESSPPSSGKSSSSSGNSYQWRCQFLCGGDAHTVTVEASNNKDAQQLTYQYGKRNCWELSRKFYKAMWGQVADCSRQ
jgi:hypothetical protein